MTTDQPSFLDRADLERELDGAYRHLARHLDAVQEWGTLWDTAEHHDLEYHLSEIRYWATTVQVVQRLVAAQV